MDMHYFRVSERRCPVDGSDPDLSEPLARALERLGPDVTLTALAEAGVPSSNLAGVAVLELPEAEAAPPSLHPWHEGEKKPR